MANNKELILRLNNELRAIVESVFEKRFNYKCLKQAFLTYSFVKAYKTHSSIIILCQNGNGQDAAILSRSLFELAVTTLYILKDSTEVRIQRWFDYDWVVRDMMYKHAQFDPEFTSTLKSRAMVTTEYNYSIEEIARKAIEMQNKYKFEAKNGWSDKSISRMATEVGLGRVYLTVYSLQSSLHHSGVRNVNDYFSIEGDRLIADVGSSLQWMDEALVSAFHFFFVISKEWNKGFNLGLDNKLLEIEHRHSRIVGNLNKEFDK